MGRLIDADELENMTFSRSYPLGGIIYVPLLEVREKISNTKTAYDVEKVVAELKEGGKCYAKYSVNTEGVKSIPTYDAIDIVKKGGVNAI